MAIKQVIASASEQFSPGAGMSTTPESLFLEPSLMTECGNTRDEWIALLSVVAMVHPQWSTHIFHTAVIDHGEGSL